MSLVFRSDTDRPIPPILRSTLLANGWVEYDESLPPERRAPFNLFWKTNRFFPSEISQCQYPYQRVNHAPKSSEITKKDSLHRHIKRMKGIHGLIYDFVPVTFVLPNEYVKFCQFYAEEHDALLDAQGPAKTREQGPKLSTVTASSSTVQPQQQQQRLIYICKPSDLSRGRKIFLFDDIGELTYDCSSVVQKYVSNPLLVHGHKVDFRIYVLVSSFQPLRAYIYKDFLLRFSVEQYSLDDLKKLCVHLTNTSINKLTAKAAQEKEGVGSGCKWDADMTREYFARAGVNFDLLWNKIENLVCLTLLSMCRLVTPIPACFELYGFDVLFDEAFKPWLMEVNFSPALSIDYAIDEKVKGALMLDMVRTLHISQFPSLNNVEPDTEKNDVQDARGTEPVCKVETDVPVVAQRRKSSTEALVTAQPARPPLAQRPKLKAPQPGTRKYQRVVRSASVDASGIKKEKSVVCKTGVEASKERAPAVHRSTSSARRLGAQATVLPTQPSSNRPQELVDSPSGKFVWCFPFNATTEKLGNDLVVTQAADTVMRAIVAEIKKRDAATTAELKGVPRTYAEYCRTQQHAATPAAAPPSVQPAAAKSRGPGQSGDQEDDAATSSPDEE